MAEDEQPVEECVLEAAVDLRQLLEAGGFEYVEVDDERTIVIYRSAILRVTVTAGEATAARAFEVVLWDPPAEGGRDPGEVLSTFLEELLTMTSVDRR